jgi:hypothetical protein
MWRPLTGGTTSVGEEVEVEAEGGLAGVIGGGEMW